jgi:hypothetical protein
LESLCPKASPSVKKQLKNYIINRKLLPLRNLAEKCNRVGGAI